jgi:uncharacterized protein (TIGR02452 family)
MLNRTSRARVASETLEILERGHYVSPSGRHVHIETLLQHARQHTVHYTPEMFGKVFAQRDATPRRAETQRVTYEVVNQTTLAAARERASAQQDLDILCLNFASAKNPGGGFLGGSSAQEESLARSSGLYPCISPMQAMYETNRKNRSCLYTDHMIYSPKVPVIRDDDGVLLDEPYCVSFLTVPAVNAGAVRNNEPEHADRIAPTMIGRMEKLLSVAVVHGHDTLILGAWGCGVFKNDSAEVAQWFYDHLVTSSNFRGRFQTVVFAVTDWSDERRFIGPFEKRFAGG